MACICCGQDEELRMGICFDCATSGERRAAQRTVLQHIGKACSNVRKGRFHNMRFDLSWAWQRMWGIGDYKPGGYFDNQHPGFRHSESRP